MFQGKLASSQIVMVSHSKETISEYCDCGLLVETGRVTFFDTVSGLLKALEKTN